jgi:hypothetical protein
MSWVQSAPGPATSSTALGGKGKMNHYGCKGNGEDLLRLGAERQKSLRLIQTPKRLNG